MSQNIYFAFLSELSSTPAVLPEDFFYPLKLSGQEAKKTNRKSQEVKAGFGNLTVVTMQV